MADTYKILGQVVSASASIVTVYTVPAGKSCAISYISILNTGDDDVQYSLHVVPAAEDDETAPLEKHTIVKSKQILTGELHSITGGVTLSAGDVLLFEGNAGSLGDIAVNAYGAEIDGVEIHKILGQDFVGLTTVSASAGYYYDGGYGTEDLLLPKIIYTVPASKNAIISSIFATNHSNAGKYYDLAVVPSGETLGVKHHIRWDSHLNYYDFDVVSSKLTLSAGDRIYALPSEEDKIGFTVFGVEV